MPTADASSAVSVACAVTAMIASWVRECLVKAVANVAVGRDQVQTFE